MPLSAAASGSTPTRPRSGASRQLVLGDLLGAQVPRRSDAGRRAVRFASLLQSALSSSSGLVDARATRDREAHHSHVARSDDALVIIGITVHAMGPI
jgi:hypothetical protein